MAKDAIVQVRVEARVLATLAKWYKEDGNIAALKSVSALVRTALDDHIATLLQRQEIEIVSHAEAENVLHACTLRVQVSPARLTNIEEESLSEEPESYANKRSTGEVKHPWRAPATLNDIQQIADAALARHRALQSNTKEQKDAKKDTQQSCETC